MTKEIKLLTELERPTYKYQFNKLLMNISKKYIGLKENYTMKSVEQDLNEFGISKFQFYRDRNIKINDSKSIPGDRLVKYSDYFQVTIDELMTYPSSAYRNLKAEIATPLVKSPLI